MHRYPALPAQAGSAVSSTRHNIKQSNRLMRISSPRNKILAMILSCFRRVVNTALRCSALTAAKILRKATPSCNIRSQEGILENVSRFDKISQLGGSPAL